MISVEEALARLLAPLQALPAEQVSVADAMGRVLAEDLTARRTQPPFAASAMDGYAVRAADVATVPATLRIVAEIPAGAGFGGVLGKGEAARIFTGAPLPEGADTIVIQEDTERDGDTVKVAESAPLGRYVRRAGLDFTEGEVLLHAGRRLTPRDVGARGGDEPAVAVRPPAAARRHPLDRRRGGDAGRSDRAEPDRQLEFAGAGGVRHRLRRGAGKPGQRP